MIIAMDVNMFEAKTRLSQLVEAAEHGQKVTIARNGVPVVQLVPVAKRKLNVGFLKGKVPSVSDSAMFAMSDEQVNSLFHGE